MTLLQPIRIRSRYASATYVARCGIFVASSTSSEQLAVVRCAAKALGCRADELHIEPAGQDRGSNLWHVQPTANA